MSGDELIDVVDAEDRVVARATRREVRTRQLRHRASYVFLFNSRSQLFVHQRTAEKDIYPSHYDLAFGGVLAAGEDYAEGARRELGEEAGIDVPLRRVLSFHFDDESNHVNGVLFTATNDGPLRLQETEVQGGSWMDLDAVLELAQREPFCPDGMEAFRLYLDRLSQVRQAR